MKQSQFLPLQHERTRRPRALSARSLGMKGRRRWRIWRCLKVPLRISLSINKSINSQEATVGASRLVTLAKQKRLPRPFLGSASLSQFFFLSFILLIFLFTLVPHQYIYFLGLFLNHHYSPGLLTSRIFPHHDRHPSNWTSFIYQNLDCDYRKMASVARQPLTFTSYLTLIHRDIHEALLNNARDKHVSLK